MGVIYKFKQEVVDFILEKKKEDSCLSCRKIAFLIQDRFQLQVSKSSVNAVIKDHSLSSPVGRAPRFKAPKNFYIPQEKKQQLLAQVSPFLEKNEKGSDEKSMNRPAFLAVTPQEPPPFVASETPPAMPLASEQDVQPQEDVVVPAALAPDVLASLHQEDVEVSQRSSERSVWDEDKGVLYKNMGSVFLRAALWEMEREPLLGAVLAKKAGFSVEDKNLCRRLEGAFFLPHHGVSCREDLLAQDNEAFSFFQEASPLEDAEILFDRPLEDETEAFCFETESVLEAMLTKVSLVRVFTEKGHVFYFDPGLKEISTSGSVGQFQPVFLYKAIEQATDQLINNVRPLAVQVPIGCIGAEKIFNNLLAALKGRDDHFTHLEFVDAKERVLVSFHALERISRKYIFMMDPSDARAFFGLQGSGTTYVLSQEPARRPINADEIRGRDASWGVFLEIRSPEAKDAVLLLMDRRLKPSNGVKFDAPVPAIFYNSLHSLSKKESVCSFLNKNITINDVSDPLSSVSQKVGLLLKDFFLSPLLQSEDPVAASASVISLAGYGQKTDQYLYVQLVVPTSFVFSSLLEEAVKVVNAAIVRDFSGRQLVLSLE